MARRLCQYCETPLPWYAKLVLIITCDTCAFRLALGGQPRRPPLKQDT